MVKVSCSSVPTADSVETSAEDSFDCEAAGEAVDEEEFDVLSADCYDSEGNEVDSDFDANELYKLLN